MANTMQSPSTAAPPDGIRKCPSAIVSNACAWTSTPGTLFPYEFVNRSRAAESAVIPKKTAESRI